MSIVKNITKIIASINEDTSVSPVITLPTGAYSANKLMNNLAFAVLKNEIRGSDDEFSIQKWILVNLFDEGEPNAIGRVVFGIDTCNDSAIVLDEFLLEEARINYDLVKHTPLMASMRIRRAPQVLILGASILKPELNFQKELCIVPTDKKCKDDSNIVVLDEAYRLGKITPELVEYINEGYFNAWESGNKILAACRSGKCLMMLSVFMMNTEDKMDITESQVEQMGLVNGIPMYNEGASLFSYIKTAKQSISSYFNIGETSKSPDNVGSIRTMTTMDELKPLLNRDCYLFVSMYSSILLTMMPEHLKNNDLKGTECTWLYFLLVHVIEIGGKTTREDCIESLVVIGTIQSLNAMWKKKEDSTIAYKKTTRNELVLRDTKCFGSNYFDEDDAGIGQEDKTDWEKMGLAMRSMVQTMTCVPSLSISATTETTFHRSLLHYPNAKAIRAGVTRGTVCILYKSDPGPDKKVLRVIGCVKEYMKYLEVHKNVDPVLMKGMILVASVDEAIDISTHINSQKWPLPSGVYNRDGSSYLKSISSTTRDKKSTDGNVLEKFQTDDNHLAFVVNKGGRGQGRERITFVAFTRTYSRGSTKEASQVASRASAIATLSQFMDASRDKMALMPVEDRVVAELAIQKYIEFQIAIVVFPEEIAYKGDRTTLVDIMKTVGFPIDPRITERAGIEGEVCCVCNCVISMEDTHRCDSCHLVYHKGCRDGHVGGSCSSSHIVDDGTRKFKLRYQDVDIVKTIKNKVTVKQNKPNKKKEISRMKRTVFCTHVDQNGFKCGGCREEMYPTVEELGMKLDIQNKMAVDINVDISRCVNNMACDSTVNVGLGSIPVREKCTTRFSHDKNTDEYMYTPVMCDKCTPPPKDSSRDDTREQVEKGGKCMDLCGSDYTSMSGYTDETDATYESHGTSISGDSLSMDDETMSNVDEMEVIPEESSGTESFEVSLENIQVNNSFGGQCGFMRSLMFPPNTSENVKKRTAFASMTSLKGGSDGRDIGISDGTLSVIGKLNYKRPRDANDIEHHVAKKSTLSHIIDVLRRIAMKIDSSTERTPWGDLTIGEDLSTGVISQIIEMAREGSGIVRIYSSNRKSNERAGLTISVTGTGTDIDDVGMNGNFSEVFPIVKMVVIDMIRDKDLLRNVIDVLSKSMGKWVEKSVVIDLVSTGTSDNSSKKNIMWHWTNVDVDNMRKSGLYMKKTNGIIKYMRV